MTNNSNINDQIVTWAMGMDARVTRTEEVLAGLTETVAAIASMVSGLASAPAPLPAAPQVALPAAPQAAIEAAPGAFKRLSAEDFRLLKVAKVVPWGMTQKDAFAAGLLGQGAPVRPALPIVASVVATQPAKAKAERAPEPEYGTEAWIAWARPTDPGAPRRADGSVTPKSEWAMRIKLANSALFSRAEIDRAVAMA